MTKRILIGVAALAVLLSACAIEPEGDRSTTSSAVNSDEPAGQEVSEAPSPGEGDAQLESTGSVPASSTTTSTTNTSATEPDERSTTSTDVDDDPDGSTRTLPEPGDGLEHPKTPNTTMVVPPPRD